MTDFVRQSGTDSSREHVAASGLRCAGCNRVFEVGDHYIVDTSSGFTKNEADPAVDDIMASIFGGSDGKLRLCVDCTQPGGDYLLETFYGDEEEA